MAKIDTTGMTKEEIIAKTEEQAKNYFKQGLNCSECVLRAYMDTHEIGLPDEAITLCTGFGGGMGHTQNNCGAVSGAVMAFGCVAGRRDPFGDFESVDRKRNCKRLITYCAGVAAKYAAEHEENKK